MLEIILILAPFVLFDACYFIRGTVLLITRLASETEDFLGNHIVRSFCWTTDLDWMLHNTNSRYLRECDFARYDLFLSAGLARGLAALRQFGITLAASSMRFRKPISFLQPFAIHTRILCWDDKAFYIEQNFMTPDGFVRATGLMKQQIIRGSPAQVVQLLTGSSRESPPAPDHVAAFIEFNRQSSDMLKKDR